MTSPTRLTRTNADLERFQDEIKYTYQSARDHTHTHAYRILNSDFQDARRVRTYVRTHVYVGFLQFLLLDNARKLGLGRGDTLLAWLIND